MRPVSHFPAGTITVPPPFSDMRSMVLCIAAVDIFPSLAPHLAMLIERSGKEGLNSEVISNGALTGSISYGIVCAAAQHHPISSDNGSNKFMIFIDLRILFNICSYKITVF